MYQYSNVRVLGVNLIHAGICADIALAPGDAARQYQDAESQSALAARLTDFDCRFGSVTKTVHGAPWCDGGNTVAVWTMLNENRTTMYLIPRVDSSVTIL